MYQSSRVTEQALLSFLGDRVKFLGPSSSAISSLQGPPLRYCFYVFLSLHICCIACIQNSALTLLLIFTYRGPTIGLQGKVVLAFEDNSSSKIGIRFDRPVPDGNDLGGLCEEDHGFFCAGNWRAVFSNFKSLENILFY